MKVDSNVNGELPLSNSIIVPAGILATNGFVMEMVVNPEAVTTPDMLVFS